MTNIYETTIIIKPDLANDQLKNLNNSIDEFKFFIWSFAKSGFTIIVVSYMLLM